MKNLLKETLTILEKNGKTEEDVVWVRTQTQKMKWNDFKKVANKVYDGGYGPQEVNYKLLVVGNDWWLERSNCGGDECWEYRELPKESTKIVGCDELEKREKLDQRVKKRLYTL